MPDQRLGEFEELVLLAIAGLGAEAYAVTVQQRLEAVARRIATMGAVYTALDRLEQKGYVTSVLGEPTARRGGRRKRYYRLTGTGKAALRAAQQMRDRLREGLQPDLGLG